MTGSHSYPAQTHNLDSTLDQFVCFLFALPQVSIYMWVVRRFWKQLPDEHLKESLRYAQALIGELMADVREHNRDGRRILFRRIKRTLGRKVRTSPAGNKKKSGTA